MEDRFIVLVSMYDMVDRFYDLYSPEEIEPLISELKLDESVEHIEVITLNWRDTQSWRWSNPNCASEKIGSSL